MSNKYIQYEPEERVKFWRKKQTNKQKTPTHNGNKSVKSVSHFAMFSFAVLTESQSVW